jgi:phage terminase large subunit-like protein
MRKAFILALLVLGAVLTACSRPPDFTISLNPTSLTVQQGSSGTTTLTITPQNGFTGTVNLSLVDGSGNSVPGITLSPTSVNVAGSGPVPQNLTVNVGSGVAPGTYILQVRATSGSLTKAVNLSLTVTPPPDFTLSLNPTSLTVQQGASGTTTLTITPQYGFTGTVALSLVDGNGNPVPGITLDPTSVSVGSGAFSQTLTLHVATGTGTYRLQLKASFRELTKTADLILFVYSGSFQLEPLPSPVIVPAGGEVEMEVRLVPSPDFDAPMEAFSVEMVGQLVGEVEDQVRYWYLSDRSTKEKLVLLLRGPEPRYVWSYQAFPTILRVQLGPLGDEKGFVLGVAPCLEGCAR